MKTSGAAVSGIGARDIPVADGIAASAPAMDRDRITVIRATNIPAADGIAASPPAMDRDRITVIRAEQRPAIIGHEFRLGPGGTRLDRAEEQWWVGDPSQFYRASSFNPVTNCCEGLNAVTEDFCNGEHWSCQDGTGNAPHPIPEHECQDDQHRIDRKALGKQHRGYDLSLDDVNE